MVGVLVAACAHSANVVEAPMISVDAAAASASSAAPTAAAERTVPIQRGDRWTGTYHCAQGVTRMAVAIEEVGTKGGTYRLGGTDRVDVQATIEFHFDGDGDWEEVDGSYRLRGTFDSKTHQLRLRGDEWIEQPPGYVMVSFGGPVKNGSTWSGAVEGPGCTTFETKLDVEH